MRKTVHPDKLIILACKWVDAYSNIESILADGAPTEKSMEYCCNVLANGTLQCAYLFFEDLTHVLVH
jgi:hypothetical protein